ncbi:MAG TPA: hypothetical protein VHJ38_18020 [Nitrososphaeraceae archaeon]|nr:hypothetical protein [Nitrososphaeraceae archaeon]
MKSIIRSILLGLNVLLVLAITTTVYNSQLLLNNNSIMANAQQIMGMPSSGMGMEQQQPGPGQYAGGTISSIQNDESGTPAWILSGLWKGALTNMDKSNPDLSTPTVNNNNNDNLPTATFEAEFDMVMLNGSALHKHSIYNFTLADISKVDDKNYQANGTATVTMKDGPVNNVPLSIKSINDNVISIWIDPTKVNNHFGNTPIFGLIQQDIVIKK